MKNLLKQEEGGSNDNFWIFDEFWDEECKDLPKCEIYDRNSYYLLDVGVSGVRKDDIRIKVSGNGVVHFYMPKPKTGQAS